MIHRSRTRCAAGGLPEGERVDYDPANRSRLEEHRERERRLLVGAEPVMNELVRHIAPLGSMIVLTDVSGTILSTRGDDRFLERAHRVALSPGVNWSEAQRGTNAIGTALVERRPTVVHADEHWLRTNHFLTCAAAPIHDALGRMIGVLDVTGDQRGFHAHTLALVHASATRIENRLILATPSEGLRVRFHTHPELIGTATEAIAVFDRVGRLVGCNRAARAQFDDAGEARVDTCLEALFGVGPTVLVQLAERNATVPVPLYLGECAAVFAIVESGCIPSTTVGPHDGCGNRRTGTPAVTSAAAVPRGEGTPATAAVSTRGSGDAAPAAGRCLGLLDTGDPAVAEAIRRAQRIVGRDIPILVLGETGTGKELIARAIHADSPRASGPFVAVNCASIPETLIESELFGYDEGAFTGARRKGSPGRILQAHGGTLFLDEIGDMPLSLQGRLLRVLQERVVTPLGSQKCVPVDLMLVCATHRSLRDLIAAGSFREDLYYRVNGLTVSLPPLRARTDLRALVQRLLADDPLGRPGDQGAAGPTGIDDAALELFERHAWPGNIRQLRNVLRTARALAFDAPVIGVEHLPDDFLEELRERPASNAHRVTRQDPGSAASTGSFEDGLSVGMAGDLESIERAAIERMLAITGNNVSETARRLGISRNTIYRKLRSSQG